MNITFAPTLDDFLAIDVDLSIRFVSEPITLDDVDALVRLTKSIVSALQAEVATYVEEPSIAFLPEVTVTQGSFKMSLDLTIDIDVDKLSDDLKKGIQELILATIFFTLPASTGQDQPLFYYSPSEECTQLIEVALHDASKTWEYFGKGFVADIEVKCGDRSVRSSIKNISK